jgi:hypothetical protein
VEGEDSRARLATVITWLLDTGPLVSYLDTTDPHHRVAATAMDGFRGRMITTAAVITEAMYVVSETRGGPQALADWISRTGTIVVEVCQPPDIREAARLMERYQDTMDFADATLVLTAELLEAFDVLTLDRRGFSAFRTSRGDPLRLVLDQRS